MCSQMDKCEFGSMLALYQAGALSDRDSMLAAGSPGLARMPRGSWAAIRVPVLWYTC